MRPWFAELEAAALPDLTRCESVADRYALLISGLPAESAEALGTRLKAPRAMQRLGAWVISPPSK